MEQRINHNVNHLILIFASIIIFGSITLLTFQQVLSLTNNHFAYALDDTYIHMAIAKNLALHGVYGVTPYEFSSSSSSPFWTVFLGVLYWIFGVSEYLPLIVNIILACGTIILIANIFQSIGIPSHWNFMLLLFIILVAPMNALIFTSMEHLLHVFLVSLYVGLFIKSVRQSFSPPSLFTLYVCTPFLAMTRFESYFLILTSVVLLFLLKQWKAGILLLVFAFLPLAFFQYISVSNGGVLLPNSVLIRSHSPGFPSFSHQVFSSFGSLIQGIEYFIMNAEKNISIAPSILSLTFLTLLQVILIVTMERTWKTPATLNFILFSGTLLCHTFFAKNGYYFRYEAYLVVMGILSFTIALPEFLKAFQRVNIHTSVKAFIVFIAIYFSIPTFVGHLKRGIADLTFTHIACRNIYEQQYQMARFIKQYYNTSTVALNDIGAVTYFSDVRLVDVVGLASVEVLKLYSTNSYTTEELHTLCKNNNVEIAIVYDDWVRLKFFPPIPPQWTKVCTWKIPYNVICGDYVVTFYAVKESAVEPLRKNLEQFTGELPPMVKVEFVDGNTLPIQDEYPYDNSTRRKLYEVYFY